MNKQEASIEAAANLEAERLKMNRESADAIRAIVRLWINGELETSPRARSKRTHRRAGPTLFDPMTEDVEKV
jgi:hypothetical protein